MILHKSLQEILVKIYKLAIQSLPNISGTTKIEYFLASSFCIYFTVDLLCMEVLTAPVQ